MSGAGERLLFYIMIDTHSHIDGEEFNDDRDLAIQRAKDAGVEKILIPAIDVKSVDTVLATCRRYPGYAYPMIGLHPEEVNAGWQTELDKLKPMLDAPGNPFIAIGEIGLDYYWSRDFEKEQLEAFEEQVKWAVDYDLPLMIHCRKAQNEMVHILKRYAGQLRRGGVFHCFTGNEKEAAQLLEFDNFVLGIGGVLTFKKSHLPDVLPHIPLERIVLETDSPYMAPVPMRGKRNESAFVAYVLDKMADVYGISRDEVDAITTKTAKRLFRLD